MTKQGGESNTKPTGESVPKQMRPTFEAIIELTDAFCQEHLTEEYAQLCRDLAAGLARKRPSPLASGRPKTWAAAIVYTIGGVNFLFDKSQTPHLPAKELCALFGLSQSAVSAKATLIRNTFNMTLLDPRWTLPSKLGDNPMAWLIQVNGLIVDARHVPREIQEEAYRKGLIPYLP